MIKLKNQTWQFAGAVVLIILAGAIFRLLWLGQIPAGLTWDEVAIGYNGWSIWQTRRDEWLTRLPISFKSFGDYKAPLAIYLNGAFTSWGDLSPFYVRLPFALMGILSLLAWWLLLKSNLKLAQSEVRLTALMGLISFCLSPTLIHFSRVGFESGIAMTFILLALWLISSSLNKPIHRIEILQLTAAGVLLALSLYTYHSAKISVPLILLAIPLIYKLRDKSSLWRYGLSLVLVFLIVITPLIKDSVWGNGLARAQLSGVTIFSQSSSSLVVIKLFVHNVWTHLSPQFLLFGQTSNIRHTALTGFVSWPIGLLFYSSVVLLLVKKFRQTILTTPLPQIGYLLIVAGLLPAVIGLETPHANRALLAVPGFILVGIYTLGWIAQTLNQFKKQLGTNLILAVMLGSLVLSFWQIDFYFKHYNATSVKEFNQGYLEAVQLAREYELGINGKPQVQQIIFDSRYGQPYIFTLFGDRIKPLAYHHGALVKYLFVDRVGVGDTTRENALLIATQDTDLLTERATTVIRGTDMSPRFIIYYLPPHDATQ